MLKNGGCEDISIDYNAKTATCKVPAAVTDEMLEKAVVGKFSVKVQN